MDTVRLRTLSFKSVFWFGKYNGLSVQQCIDSKRIGYLFFIYYNIAGVSFSDEVLRKIDLIGETFDHRIKKPGSDVELFEKLKADQMEKRQNKDYMDKKTRGREKVKLVKTNRRERIYFSRRSLQSRNQGH